MEKILLILTLALVSCNQYEKEDVERQKLVGKKIVYCNDTVEIINYYTIPNIGFDLSNGKTVSVAYVTNKGTF